MPQSKMIMVKWMDPKPRFLSKKYHVEVAGYEQNKIGHLRAWSIPFETEKEAHAFIAKGALIIMH